jgi:purine-cytosine permease-like protein
MRILGILLALAGWLLPVLALSMTQSIAAIFGACLLGIIISLVGILGVLNGVHQANALWKKG